MSEIVKKLEGEATNLDVTASMYTPGLQINRNNPYSGRMVEVCKRAAAKLRECAEAIAALQPVEDDYLKELEKTRSIAIHMLIGCKQRCEDARMGGDMISKAWIDTLIELLRTPVAVDDAMVERTAKQMSECAACDDMDGVDTWAGLPEEIKQSWRNDAREVLEAALQAGRK